MALAAFTEMRRGENLELCWKDVDLANQRVYFTETKNGTLRVLALNGLAVQVLESLPEGDVGDLVFPEVNPAHLSVYTRSVLGVLVGMRAEGHFLATPRIRSGLLAIDFRAINRVAVRCTIPVREMSGIGE